MSTVSNSGCVLFLVDESARMGTVVEDVMTHGKSKKSNADRIATAFNSLLNQLTDGADFEVALIGYRTDSAGDVQVGSRWSGPLAGREFVKVSELAADPIRVETRTRKIPAPDGMGVAHEESVEFPIWYEPTLGATAPQIAAFDFCHQLLSRWLADAGSQPAAPLIVHVTAGASSDGNSEMAVKRLLELDTPTGTPLLFHAHMASSATAMTCPYPSSHVYLTLGSARDLYRRSSPLPESLIAALKDFDIEVNPGARGMLYNARILDVIRLFGLVKAYTKDWPSGDTEAEMDQDESAEQVVVLEEEAVPEAFDAEGSDITLWEEKAEMADLPGDAEKAAIIVLLLDRSIEDPFRGDLQNPFTKLQDHANDLLTEISEWHFGDIDTAVVSYGLGPEGKVEIGNTFDGPLAGKTIVPAIELADGALRVDQIEELVSDGTGTLITLNVRKPIYVELEPTASVPPADAFAAAAQIASDWCTEHPTACLSPIVLHLTRGCFDTTEIEVAASQLQTVRPTAGPLTLYHLVVTESPHKSIAYPTANTEIENAVLQKLREVTSPLLGREMLAAAKPTVTPESLGMVINGKFDLLREGLEEALAS